MAGPVRRYNVPQLVAEARLRVPMLVLEGYEGGKEFEVPPPELWSDEQMAAAGKAAQQPEAFVRALLGDQFEAWRAAGGHVRDVTLVLQAYAREQGLPLGESSGSSGSSGSTAPTSSSTF